LLGQLVRCGAADCGIGVVQLPGEFWHTIAAAPNRQQTQGKICQPQPRAN
jgi:hypothetical protein